MLRWILVAPLVGLLACSTSHSGGDAAADSGVDGNRPDTFLPDTGLADRNVPDRPDAGMCIDIIPLNDRPAAWDCSPCRPPGAGMWMEGECSTDADCTMGMNGRCVGARFGGMCSYDTCFSDSDCGANELCACDGGFGGGNTCIQAGCRTNADCGGGFNCSPTLGDCGHYVPPVAYFCHTANDECYSDAECGLGYCAFNSVRGVWACSTAECAG